jgi:Alpha-galactosidase
MDNINLISDDMIHSASENASLPDKPVRTELFSFAYGGVPADFASWRREELASDDSGVPVTTLRFTAPDGFYAETVTRHYDGIVSDYILYFGNGGSNNSAEVSAINTLDLRVTAGTEGKIDDRAHLLNPLYRFMDENQPVLHLVKNNLGCVCPKVDEMAEDFRVLRAGDKFETGGNCCTGDFSPYFDLAWPGGGVTFALGWTGLWRAELENDIGVIHITAGIKRGRFFLEPGERVRSCRIMYTFWSGEPETGYLNFRRMFIKYVSPRNPDNTLITCPITSSNPEENGTNGEHEIQWVSHDMDGLEAEMYWHDAWWHRGGFPAGMGNYASPGTAWDPERYPQGMEILGRLAHEKGYKFCLWFAPEDYPDSCDVAKLYPGYLLHLPGHAGGNPNLADEESFNFFFNFFDTCIKNWHIDTFRTDSGYNLAVIAANEEPDREGVLEMKYVQGLYRLWDALRESNPGLVIDNCCGGGTRLELELCSRSVSYWRTDSSVWYGCGDRMRNSIMSQSFNLSFNRFVPFTMNAAYDYDPYNVRSTFNSGAQIYMDIRRPDFDKSVYRMAAREIKRLRRYIFGDFYRIVNSGYNPYSWCVYQYHLPESGEGCVFVFRRDNSPYPECKFTLKAVDPAKKYEVAFYYGYERAETRYMSGRDLTLFTARLEGAPSSLLLEYRERPLYLRK